MTIRSHQCSSEQDSDQGSPVSTASDGQGDISMYGNAGEAHDSPAAGIDALHLSKEEDNTTTAPIPQSASTPSSSSIGSGNKRRASDSIPLSYSAGKKHLAHTPYVLQHEQRSRVASRSPPKKHLISRAAKRHSAFNNNNNNIIISNKDSSDDLFVAKALDKSQRVDSAFTPSLQSRAPTWPTNVPPVADLLKEKLPGFNHQPHDNINTFGHARQPGLFRQPETSPITQEQLAAEVKGIYAGLVMVEAKSINIDAQQAADPTSKLAPEQWQALIALRRTLLYEHHDFLMATQHPSASPALRGLAAKYCMPARMWKHGIHGFLEVLRHRRPESQEYMLTFIYLAYDMMALLFETVPAFTDTWIECLGDLARYRMAIEEDKEVKHTDLLVHSILQLTLTGSCHLGRRSSSLVHQGS